MVAFLGCGGVEEAILTSCCTKCGGQEVQTNKENPTHLIHRLGQSLRLQEGAVVGALWRAWHDHLWRVGGGVHW